MYRKKRKRECMQEIKWGAGRCYRLANPPLGGLGPHSFGRGESRGKNNLYFNSNITLEI